MDYLLLTLRIVHILAGVFWVGGTLVMTFLVAPAVGATGEAGQKFMGHLVNSLKFSARMSAAAGLTVLAGFALFWIDSDGFTSAWMSTGAGRGFGIGAAFALIGLVTGSMIGRTLKALAELGAQIQGKPTPEQATRLQALQKRQAALTNVTAIALILATIFMAIARYFVF